MTHPATSQPDAPLGPRDLARRYFIPLIAGLVILRLAVLTIYLATFIPAPVDITFPEGALLTCSLRVAHGESPYQDWRQWPHQFAPYPPLAYYPAGWLVRGLGVSGDPVASLIVARAFCYGALLGLLATLYLLGRRLGLSPPWSLLGVALFAEYQILMEFSVSFRPDGPKTLFAMLALGCAARGRPTGRSVLAALACLMASLWFKPTAWGVAIVIAVWIWHGWGTRRALAVGAAFLAAGLIPLLILDARWGGNLRLNLIDSLRNGMDPGLLAKIPHLLAGTPLAILLLGTGVALVALRSRAPLPGRAVLAAVPASLLAALIQFLKVGSDDNYFLDCFPLAALAVAWWASRLWNGDLFPIASGARARNRALGHAILFLVLAPLPLYHSAIQLATIRDDFQTMKACWPEGSPQREMRRIQGPVLAANPFLAMYHAEPAVLDYFQYATLARRGAIDPEPLLSRVRAQYFTAIEISEEILDLTKKDESFLYCKGFTAALNKYYYRRDDSAAASQFGKTHFLFWFPRPDVAPASNFKP